MTRYFVRRRGGSWIEVSSQYYATARAEVGLPPLGPVHCNAFSDGATGLFGRIVENIEHLEKEWENEPEFLHAVKEALR
ncbi:hypothetical protein C4568_01185 [Candidatus Parcubacteria bacterium]|nr:MAG: hypothetical protein C4568_01185 [Candidatus Parcubacteria bacterium]